MSTPGPEHITELVEDLRERLGGEEEEESQAAADHSDVVGQMQHKASRAKHAVAGKVAVVKEQVQQRAGAGGAHAKDTAPAPAPAAPEPAVAAAKASQVAGRRDVQVLAGGSVIALLVLRVVRKKRAQAMLRAAPKLRRRLPS